MIYIQLNTRVKLTPGQKLRLGDAARVMGAKGLEKVLLPCPEQLGIWKLPAIDVAKAASTALPGEDVTMLGPDVCFIHRVVDRKSDFTRLLRTAAAFLILCLGAALGLSWFHADVDMPRAQFEVYKALTGEEPSDPRLITIPYIIGVALGVAVFYALPSRKATTPLEVKLTEYQADMEQTEGRDMEDANA